MKKFIKKLNFALIAMFVSGAAMAAPAGVTGVGNICTLISQMHGIFKTLRTLAFVGAAFIIADWAWGWIKSGTVKKDDVQDKGIALLVGFTVLFGIGMVLTAVIGNPALIGCPDLLDW